MQDDVNEADATAGPANVSAAVDISAVSDVGRPRWARRLRDERQARGWSQAQAVRAMRAHADGELTSDSNLVRNLKRWEKGEAEPDAFYRPLLARTYGTVTAALFPAPATPDERLLSATGMGTLEIVQRLRASDVTDTTLAALELTVDRLCSEYPHMPSEQLLIEGRQWLRRMTDLLHGRLTLTQHREVLRLAGFLALLVGCVEYDMGQRAGAEGTRSAALSIGQEAGSGDVVGWAHEMAAWFALTQGDYRGVITAADTGLAAAGETGVAVQLAAQKAKAWARVGDRRQVEVALDRGRTLLEALPYPTNLDNHFVVDPAKFDYYAMDCYRLLGEDRLAATYADEVLRIGSDFDGRELSPMRNAEARITRGVVAARAGDLDSAVHEGQLAIAGNRKSLPSLLMVSRELAHELRRHDDGAPAREYLGQLRDLAADAGAARPH